MNANNGYRWNILGLATFCILTFGIIWSFAAMAILSGLGIVPMVILRMWGKRPTSEPFHIL